MLFTKTWPYCAVEIPNTLNYKCSPMNEPNKPTPRRWWQYLLGPLLLLIFKNIGPLDNTPNWVWLILVLLTIPFVAVWQRKHAEAEDPTEPPPNDPPNSN